MGDINPRVIIIFLGISLWGRTELIPTNTGRLQNEENLLNIKREFDVRNILVTGANSFIGRALCKKMLAEGWRVRGTVRDSKHYIEIRIENRGKRIEEIE